MQLQSETERTGTPGKKVHGLQKRTRYGELRSCSGTRKACLKMIQNAEIAQSVEQRIENPRVTSSILVLGNGRVSEWSMVLVLKTNVA